MLNKVIYIMSIFLYFYLNLYSMDDAIIEQWQKVMKYGISAQRTEVIKSIERMKATNAYFLIQNALTNDDNSNVKITAANTLMNLKISNENLWITALNKEGKLSKSDLTNAQSQKLDSEVVRTIVYGIGFLKIYSASQNLMTLLENIITNEKETYLTGTVIRALGELSYKNAAPYLANILTNNSYANEIRSASALSLGEIADATYIPLLETILKNPLEDKGIKMYTAYAIGKTGDLSAINILMPIIENDNEDLNIRLWALAGISTINNTNVINKLISFAKYDNVRIRMEAVKALGNVKDNNEVIEVLKFKSLYDPDLGIKREAKKSLQKLGIEVDSN